MSADVLKVIQENWPLVRDHPWAFVSVFVAGVGVGWAGVSLLFKERMELLKERAGKAKDRENETNASPGAASPAVAPIEICRAELRLLRVLSEHRTAQISALESATSLTRGQIEFYVTRLERAGAVTCTDDLLGGRNVVHITHVGRDLLFKSGQL